jgi:hypothetical protein
MAGLAALRDTDMRQLHTLWEITAGTYGGAPLVTAVLLVQLYLLCWVVKERWNQRREDASGADEEMRKAQAVARADVWRMRVRPLVITLMLLGPGLGLAMSTLVGSFGMASLGNVMGQQTSLDVLLPQVATAYREVSYAYLLMVGGTAPMLLGPLIILAAGSFERAASLSQGGDVPDLVLHELKQFRLDAERHAAQARQDAAVAADLFALLAQEVKAARAGNASGSRGRVETAAGRHGDGRWTA